jgi:hypothetical protein
MDDNSKQGFARVPVTITPVGWRKPTELEAVCGEVRGRGTSQAKAVADVAEQLANMAAHAADFTETSVWADESGLWFAYPDGRGGHHAVRVHGVTVAADARVSSTSSGRASVADAFETSEGMRRVSRPPLR